MGLIDLGGLEGALGGAIRESIGEGLPIRWHFGAGGVSEDIENLCADEQRFFQCLEVSGDLLRGQIGRGFHGDIARDGWELRQVLKLGRTTTALAHGAEQKLGYINGAPSIDLTCACRVDLGDPTEDAIATADLAVEQTIFYLLTYP